METKKIILFGAGRSSYYILAYFQPLIQQGKFSLKVLSDSFPEDSYVHNFPQIPYEIIDIHNADEVDEQIQYADLVISMLPAALHILLAPFCIKNKVSLFTASYLSEEMKKMDEEVCKNNLLFLNECGLDPGLDHMSAKKIIDEIEENGGKIITMESFTGGLVAPESDDNPWNYKITWNPKNVVLAGQGGAARFYQKGTLKYIPYTKLFRRTEVIEILDYGKFEGYANRDSTQYKYLYNLKDAETVFRGTLRRLGFCKAWDKLIQLGFTDDSYIIPDSENLTYREFTNLFLAYNPYDSVEIKLQRYLNIEQDDFALWDKLTFLGLFSHDKIGVPNASPARVLQHILEQKLRLKNTDKDMIAMHHIFEYEIKGVTKKIQSSLVVLGHNQHKTAMAKTVGLPIAIAAKLYLEGKINAMGVKIPVDKNIYAPILNELKQEYKIIFVEK